MRLISRLEFNDNDQSFRSIALNEHGLILSESSCKQNGGNAINFYLYDFNKSPAEHRQWCVQLGRSDDMFWLADLLSKDAVLVINSDGFSVKMLLLLSCGSKIRYKLPPRAEIVRGCVAASIDDIGDPKRIIIWIMDVAVRSLKIPATYVRRSVDIKSSNGRIILIGNNKHSGRMQLAVSNRKLTRFDRVVDVSERSISKSSIWLNNGYISISYFEHSRIYKASGKEAGMCWEVPCVCIQNHIGKYLIGVDKGFHEIIAVCNRACASICQFGSDEEIHQIRAHGNKYLAVLTDKYVYLYKTDARQLEALMLRGALKGFS